MYNILLGANFPTLITGLCAIAQNTLPDQLKIHAAVSFPLVEVALLTSEIKMLIIDMAIVRPGNINALKNLKRRYPLLKIVILYNTNDKETVKLLYTIGALGFLPKKATINHVVICLQKVYKGEVFIENDMLLELINEPYTFCPTLKPAKRKHTSKKIKQRIYLLTNREKLIANLLIEGKSIKQICSLLVLRPSTVSTFKKNVLIKLKITGLLELEKLE